MTQIHWQPQLILIDGSNFLYRAFHAIKPLNTSTGQASNAIYGVGNMLRRLLKQYNDCQHWAVIFDAPGETFRQQLYQDYKAQREAMPDELFSQLPILMKLINYMGLKVLQIPQVEADDIIASLAILAQAQQQKVLIATGDKDLAQLVNQNIILYDSMREQYLDITGVIEKFGVKPEQIIDYLSLTGDKSDNIPGIPKVGEKTAQKWIQEYENIDNLLQHAAMIKGQVGNNLRQHQAQLTLNQQLIEVKKEIKVIDHLNELIKQPENQAGMIELLSQLEFRSWLKEYQSQPSPINLSLALPSQHSVDYILIQEEESFSQLLQTLSQSKLICLDLETTDLDPLLAKMVGIAFAIETKQGYYIPLGHSEGYQLAINHVVKAIKPLLEDPHIAKCGHHIKYDYRVLLNYNIKLANIQEDTSLIAYLLESHSKQDLDSLALKHLNHQNITYKEVAGKDCFSQVAIDMAAEYAVEDAVITYQLYQLLRPQLSQTSSLENLYKNIEIPLITILAQMEHNGVCIDTQLLYDLSQEFSVKINTIEKEVHQIAGKSFNLNSTKQLQSILFEDLNLPVLQKTPGGKPSTGEEVLQELAIEHKIAQLLLNHRSLSKLKSTYTDKLGQMLNPNTQRLHTSYHQTGTVTGRLSSSNPNLQNIPIRTEEGKRIRQAFIAQPDYVLLAADYSQIELRIMAHLSQDQGLLTAFTQKEDIHKATAAEIFNIPISKVTSEQRRSAKAINFGLMYGMSAFGLAKQLSIPRSKAQDYIEQYFSRYPGVKNYLEQTRELAKTQGYVETVLGRRLYLPDIKARKASLRAQAERAAINAPMQGTAADIIKQAMLDIDLYIQQEQPEIKMLMQVHDELVFELPEKQVEQVKPSIQTIMQKADQGKLSVALIVEIGIGNNWQQAH